MAKEKGVFDEFNEVINGVDESKRLERFFQQFIKEKTWTATKEIVPGLTVTLTPLSAGELLKAESVVNFAGILPADVYPKIRAVGVLSRAIIAIGSGGENDDDRENFLVNLDDDTLTDKEKDEQRTMIYHSLLKMPPYIVQKMYEFYRETVEEYNNQFEGDIVGDTKAF